jgi:hypothetical protein
MKRNLKIWLIVLCFLCVSVFLVKYFNLSDKHRLDEEKTESREGGKIRQPPLYSEKTAQKSHVSSVASGRPIAVPSDADEMAQILNAKNASLINPWGNPNTAAIIAITGSREELTRRIEQKIQATMNDISVKLKKLNADVAPFPWRVGTKAHLKGLEPSELAAITSSLQTSLSGVASEDIIEKIIQRFTDGTKIYAHSVDVEVIENINKDGGIPVSGGRAYFPTWYRVMERDRNGILVSDKNITDNLGPLGNQMLPAR